MELGGKGLQVGELSLGRPLPLAIEETEQLLHVALVGVEGVGREAALQLQVAQEASELSLVCWFIRFCHGSTRSISVDVALFMCKDTYYF